MQTAQFMRLEALIGADFSQYLARLKPILFASELRLGGFSPECGVKCEGI
jgi:hypothetical protein